MVMTIISGVFDYFLGTGGEVALRSRHRRIFCAEFAAMSSIIYFLVRYFVVRWKR